MTNQHCLEFLKDHFRKASLDCDIVEIDEGGKRRLLVFLGTDNRENGVTMEVTSQEISLEGQLFSPALDNEHAYVRIQFDVSYAFAVKEEAILDVSQFLQFLNLQIELPGFYLDAVDNRIIYRYVWLCERGHIHPPLALNIVGMVMFFQASFESVLESLALRKRTYLSLLEEILNPG